MPDVLQSIIETVTQPPFATLHSALDLNGPFGAGDHTFTSFSASAMTGWPAASHSVYDTLGVLAVVNGTIPIHLGYTMGWIDPTGTDDETIYQRRFCQLVLQRRLILTGLWLTVDRQDMYTTRLFMPWPTRMASQGRLGLHVEPGISIDLHYLVVLP
jgi:hypothetical protein